MPYLRADSHALRTRAPLDPKVSFDLHVLGMPPAFVLRQKQTLKLMYDQTPAGISERKTGISGSRSCTKITIWCVCVFETYELPHRSKLRAGSISIFLMMRRPP